MAKCNFPRERTRLSRGLETAVIARTPESVRSEGPGIIAVGFPLPFVIVIREKSRKSVG